MGTQFYWFYDILIIAVFLGITFKCYKKGFISSLFGLIAVLVAFTAGLFLSGIMAAAIYNGFIKERVSDYIDKHIEELSGSETLSKLSEVDTSKILLKGEPVSEINITRDSIGNIEMDLSEMDLSGTGLDKLDLHFLGIGQELAGELSAVNGGKIVITSSELAKNNLEDLILAKALTNTLQSNIEFEVIGEAAQTVGNLLPQLSNNFNNGVNSAVSEVIVTMIQSGGSGINTAILDNLITPVIMLPLRTLIFFILFAIICVALSILTRSLSIVNRIPIVGTVNSLLGIVIGVLQAAIVVFIICIGISILITLTGNSIIFINTMTIEESLLFKHIYNFDFIQF
ncbi:MAG: hypothetical protein FWG44_07420 [Oscillospiraceae bacterium]|nr:hypothetical protein [Oscillospiraceae bacterium]